MDLSFDGRVLRGKEAARKRFEIIQSIVRMWKTPGFDEAVSMDQEKFDSWQLLLACMARYLLGRRESIPEYLVSTRELCAYVMKAGGSITTHIQVARMALGRRRSAGMVPASLSRSGSRVIQRLVKKGLPEPEAIANSLRESSEYGEPGLFEVEEIAKTIDDILCETLANRSPAEVQIKRKELLRRLEVLWKEGGAEPPRPTRPP
jgi:hypothetical protein